MAENETNQVAFNKDQLFSLARGNRYILEIIQDQVRLTETKHKSEELAAKLKSEADAGQMGDAMVTQAKLMAVELKLMQDEEAILKKQTLRSPESQMYKRAQVDINNVMGAAFSDEATLHSVYKELSQRETGIKYA